MRSHMLWACLVTSIAFTGCSRQPSWDNNRDIVTRVTFSSMNQAPEQNVVITDPDSVREIVDCIYFGETVPLSLGPFQDAASCTLPNGKVMYIAFAEINNAYFLRNNGQQYITTKECFDLLSKYTGKP